jgi:hypothetical protein
MKVFNIRSLILILSVFFLMSCTKDQDDRASILGAWIETAPVEGRTEMYFSPGNQLTIFDNDESAEEFMYKLREKSIQLELRGDAEGRSELYFEMINNNKFKIGNLHPSIPEAEPIFLIFERR